MRISELADQVGVPTSTVRYYERVGLLGAPERTSSGYRDYDGEAATRLLLVSRARQLGLSCDQIAELLPIWDGANCSSAYNQVVRLIEDKRAEVAARIAELIDFADQLERARETLEASPPLGACRTDLMCCMPDRPDQTVLGAAGAHRTALPVLNC